MSGRRGTDASAGTVVGVGLGVVLAGMLASAVVASRIDDGSDLTAAIEEAPLVRAADIAAGDGLPGAGCTCRRREQGISACGRRRSATSRERGGGCNTADDPLNGRPVSFTLSYDGGPAVSDVRSATHLRPRYLDGHAGFRGDERRKRAGDSASRRPRSTARTIAPSATASRRPTSARASDRPLSSPSTPAERRSTSQTTGIGG